MASRAQTRARRWGHDRDVGAPTWAGDPRPRPFHDPAVDDPMLCHGFNRIRRSPMPRRPSRPATRPSPALGKRFHHRLPLWFEELESRDVPSAFYDLTPVASTTDG